MLPIVTGFTRQPQTVFISERHSQKFGLRAAVRSHPRVAVRRPRVSRVGSQACITIAARAVIAVTATNMRRNRHTISTPHRIHCRSDLFNNADRLMADDKAGDVAHTALVDMQIRSTDRAGGQTQKRIGRRFYASVIDGVDGEIAQATNHNGSHMCRSLPHPRLIEVHGHPITVRNLRLP